MNLVMLWRRKLLLVKFIEFILIMIVPASPKQVVVGEASLFIDGLSMPLLLAVSLAGF